MDNKSPKLYRMGHTLSTTAVDRGFSASIRWAKGMERRPTLTVPSADQGRSNPRCPACRREIAWQGNPHRPFCSITCRLIDLGVWLDEGYRIAGGAAPAEQSADTCDRERGG